MGGVNLNHSGGNENIKITFTDDRVIFNRSVKSVEVRIDDLDLSFAGLKPIADELEVEVKELWKKLLALRGLRDRGDEDLKRCVLEILGDQELSIVEKLELLKGSYTEKFCEWLKRKLLDDEYVKYELRNVRLEDLEIVLFDKVKVEVAAHYMFEVLRELGFKFVKFPNGSLFLLDRWHLISYDVIEADLEALFPTVKKRLLKTVLQHEILKNAQTIEFEDVNPDGLLLFNNGVLDLNTLSFQPYNPNLQLYFTYKIPYNLNPGILVNIRRRRLEDWEAEIPRFIGILKRLFPKENLFKAVEMLGSIFITSCLRKIFIVYGPAGVGKSTFGEILSQVLRGVSSNMSLEAITEGRFNYQLMGKLVNISTEGSWLSIGRRGLTRLNRLSGEETLMFEEKYKPAIKGRNHIKLIFLMNDIPFLKENDDAILERLYLIETTDEPLPIDERKTMNTVIRELKGEFEGIIHFLLWCSTQIIDENGIIKFKHDMSIDEKRELINWDLNPIAQWIEENCELQGREERTELYANYTAWARENGKKQFTKHQFYDFLRQNFKEKVIGGTYYFEGIKLRREAATLKEILKMEDENLKKENNFPISTKTLKTLK